MSSTLPVTFSEQIKNGSLDRSSRERNNRVGLVLLVSRDSFRSILATATPLSQCLNRAARISFKAS